MLLTAPCCQHMLLLPTHAAKPCCCTFIGQQVVVIDKEQVLERLAPILKKQDLTKYIL